MNNNENEEKLINLVKLIKQARNESLLGLYNSALTHYNQSMIIIRSKIYDANDNKDIIENWKITEYNIKNEIMQIKQMYEICKEINNSEFNYSKKQLENIENKKLIEKEVLEMIIKENKIEKNRNTFLSFSDSTKKHKIYTAKINLTNDNKNNGNKVNQWLYYKQRRNNNKINKDNTSPLQKNDDNDHLKKNKSTIFIKQKKMINPLEEWYNGTTNKKISELNDNYLKQKTEINPTQNNIQIKNNDIYLIRKLSNKDFFHNYERLKKQQISNMNNRSLNKKKSYNIKKRKKTEVIKIDLDEEINKIEKNNEKRED